MPAPTPLSFTVEYNGVTRVLWTEAIVSMAFNPVTTKQPPKPERFKAIWDTGATSTAISSQVVRKCGLAPTGMTRVETAQGTCRSRTYLINIGLPNNVAFAELGVAEAQIAGDAEILIGMDIISKGDLAVTNTGGKTTFTFRMPSSQRLDFVRQPVPAAPAQAKGSRRKIGRNERCPCGSGRKYKNCCMRKET